MELLEVRLIHLVEPLIVFSHIKLDTGFGDVTYNSRRNLLCAIPLAEKAAYHLWDLGYSGQKSNYGAKLLKKSKWQSQYSSRRGY